MNFSYVIAVVFLAVITGIFLTRAIQLKHRLDEKIAEKNKLFDENRNLAEQSEKLIAENTKWRERVTNAENLRDKAQQQSFAAESKLIPLRQELDAAKAVARAAEGALATDARVKELETAICKHRDAKGHDRCWQLDRELYDLVGGTIDTNEMPPLPEFMSRCAAYYEGQCRIGRPLERNDD